MGGGAVHYSHVTDLDNDPIMSDTMDSAASEFFANISSSAIPMFPVPDASRPAVNELMPHRCCRRHRIVVLESQLWLEVAPGYQGPKGDLGHTAWLQLTAALAPCPGPASAAAGVPLAFCKAALDIHERPGRTGRMVGTVPKFATIRIVAFSFNGATNQMWGELGLDVKAHDSAAEAAHASVGEDRALATPEAAWVCTSTCGAHGDGLVLEPIELTGYLQNVFARHYRATLPVHARARRCERCSVTARRHIRALTARARACA